MEGSFSQSSVMMIDDEGITIVIDQQSAKIGDFIEQDSEVDNAPLNVVRPESMESGPIKRPGGRFKHRAQRKKTYKRKKIWPSSNSAKSDNDDNYFPMRKGGRPTGCKSAKGNMGRKPALAYSSNSDSEGERDDDDDDFDPARKRRWQAGSKFAKNNKDNNFVPTRKRGRLAGSKFAKSKMGRKPALTHICSSNSEGERGKGGVFDPTAPDADGRKKHASDYKLQGSGPAFKRASEVQEKLRGAYPSFTKCMRPSNVDRVFWLHISSKFCRRYLPKKDTIMTLEDENTQRNYAKYLSGSYGLSGGWARFAKDHSLKVGDTVVFELVKPTKFKVYIKRKDEFTTAHDDDMSKEDPGVTTRDSSSAPSNDSDNLAGEEAVGHVDDGMGSPDPGIKDPDSSITRSSTDQPSVEREGYKEVMLEKDHAAEKMKALKLKLAALTDSLNAVHVEVEELESSMKKNAQVVQQMVNAPW